VMNSVRPIPAHGLGLPGWRPVARGRPQGLVPATPVGAHQPRSPHDVCRPWRNRRRCPDRLCVAGEAARAPGRRGRPAEQGVGERGRIEEPIGGEAAEASMAATFHGEGGRPAVGENSDEVLRLGEEDRKVRHQLNQSKNRGATLTVKGRSRWCSGVVHAKTSELQRSKAANRVGVMRGRQQRNWTWSGGCDGNDK
jgi:hypothetical protein